MILVALLGLIGCSHSKTISQTEAGRDIDRGAYLVTILGCGGCHTEGALLGQPAGEWLAGSTMGVAYTADEHDQNPGVVFPKNLTSDPRTGLGNWSLQDIELAIAQGRGHQDQTLNAVMPWMSYGLLRAADRRDIASYLQSLPPVYNPIPSSIEPGEPVRTSYLRVGLYIFYPSDPPVTRP